MLKNLVKYSFRAFRRQKVYVFINVLGLSIGLACSLIIALFIRYELSFDRFHENKDRLYRVILHGKISGQELQVTSTASPIGPTMMVEFPEVENYVRLNGWGETILRYGDKPFTEEHFLEADSTFFEMFSVPLIRGNIKTVLNKKHSLVLSESNAGRIFGEEDPINKMVKVGNDSTLYVVTGIMADMPPESHFHAAAIGSFMTNPRASDDQWLSNSFSTYVLLYPGSDPQLVDDRFADMVVKYVGPLITRFFGATMEEFLSVGNKYNLYLQPLTDIHLNPSIQQEFGAANDPKYLWIFGSIAVLILIIAAINFMNLSTAQGSKRAKEVGIKKVSGSTQGLLIIQFLTETILLSYLALIITILITELALSPINQLLDIHLKVGYLQHWYTLPVLLLATTFIGLLAGIYPAFYLSSFNPYMVLKGIRTAKGGNKLLKSTLVVLQFSISIVLIVGTLIMFRQIQFMLDKDLGFDKDQVLVIRRASTIGDKLPSFKDELRRIPGVLNVSSSTAVPGHNNNNNGYMIKGRPEDSFLLQTNWVDHEYLNVYGIELADGRFFDPQMATDEDACLVNEDAVKRFILDDPFSVRFELRDDEEQEVEYMPIIGVVKDFHFESMHRGIGPYMLQFQNENMLWGYISVKLSPEASKTTLEEIESVWGSFTNNDPMQSFFMDKDFDRLYREEEQNSRLAIVFTILAILIAAIGLYGLTAFTVQQRTKEIGVRKTFGASVFTIWALVAREILILVAIATAFAWPLVYWVADNWLQNYHYRIKLHPTDFLYGFLIALLIALATISHRTIQTALVNPAESLRYE
jgi:putative ABC transport system permease protein